MNNGYVQLRRGILQHCIEGKLPPTQFAAYVHLILEADKSSGIVWSSAKSLSSRYGYEERYARSVLEVLEEKGYIRRFATPGKQGVYPIFVNKYVASTGAMKGMMLNASKSKDWKSPVFETCEDEGEQKGELNAPKQEGEGKGESKESSDTPSASPGPGMPSKPKPPTKNRKGDNPVLAALAESLVPLYIERAGKRSYALDAKASRGGRSTRRQVIVNGLKLIQQAILLQNPSLSSADLMQQTENAAKFIVEEFSKSDWHMCRDPKTNGTAYDDLASYAFGDMAMMEKWLKW